MIADVDANTFPSGARLRTPKQFQATFSQGRRISAALFRLHVLLAESTHASGLSQSPVDGAMSSHVLPKATPMATPTARLGISVSKRVATHAVERNRIKRIVRDSFRQRRRMLPHGDYVLLAQRDAAGAPSAALREALSALWQRAIALKPAVIAPTMPARAGVDGESL